MALKFTLRTLFVLMTLICAFFAGRGSMVPTLERAKQYGAQEHARAEVANARHKNPQNEKMLEYFLKRLSDKNPPQLPRGIPEDTWEQIRKELEGDSPSEATP